MHNFINVFERVEKKYFIDEAQYRWIMNLAGEHLVPDTYPRGSINNLYLDTPNFLLIRNSIDAVGYKEKLRVRCYGLPNEDSNTFLELKKKYKGVVYKRRMYAPLKNVMYYIENGVPIDNSQIMHEIDYAMQIYNRPKPAIKLCYEREAWRGTDTQHDLRITFDTQINYSFDNPDLLKRCDTIPLQTPKPILMEVKSGGGVPVWLSRALSECKAFPSPFSKYGTAYKNTLVR